MLGTELKPVIIHTDGGCQGNPGPGGWASIMRHNEHIRELSGGEPVTTCNRMELTAAIQALKALKRPCAVTLFTDSQYLRSGITEWIHSWKRRNWQTADKKPVQNADLWLELEALTSGHKVQWQWLKGHAGHGDNERCDQLATAAISEIRKKFSTQQLSALRKTFQSQRLHGLRQGTIL